MLIRRAQVLCALTLVVFLSWGCASAFGEVSSWQLQASHTGGFTGGISCWSTSSCETVGEPGSVPELIDGRVRIRRHATGFGQIWCASGRCLSLGTTRDGLHATLQWSTDGRFGPVRRFQPRATRRFKGALLPAAASCPARGDCYVIATAGVVTTKNQCTTSSGSSKGGTSGIISCRWSATGGVPVVLHWNGHLWSASRRLPLPRAAATVRGRVAVRFVKIACATRDRCEAIGLWAPQGDLFGRPFAERWNGRRWSAQAMPLPPPAAHGRLRRLILFGDLSCPTIGVCMVVGSRGLGVGRRGLTGRTFAMRYARGHWSLISPPAMQGTLPSSLACMSANRCILVGSRIGRRHERPASELWTPSGWSAVPMPAPPGEVFLTGVSCPSATTCEAVGTYFGPKGFGWFLERYAPSP